MQQVLCNCAAISTKHNDVGSAASYTGARTLPCMLTAGGLIPLMCRMYMSTAVATDSNSKLLYTNDLKPANL
jgi:hypothetical protein